MRLLRSGNDKATAIQDSWLEFTRELERSRRYGRVFSLVRFSTRPRARNGTGGSHDAAASLLEQVASRIRSLDRAWPADDGVFVLLPECERPMAEAFVARLETEAPGLLDQVAVRAVAFPMDGLTTGSLLDALDTRLHATRPGTSAARRNAGGPEVTTDGDRARTAQWLAEWVRVVSRRGAAAPTNGRVAPRAPAVDPAGIGGTNGQRGSSGAEPSQAD